LRVILNAVLLEKFSMKTVFLAFVFFLFGICGYSQQDTTLVNRINQMLKFTQLKDLEKIMDYTYPKLFEFASKELMLATLKESFENDEFNVELDSISIVMIHPVFVVNDTSYVKVKHSMLMRMKFKEPLDTADMESKNFMVTLMGVKYGEQNVRFDAVANSLNILMKPDMIGIKDKTTNIWTFANLVDDNPAILEMLFSKAVRDKLNEYN
jgi:hypothetical protein